MKKAIVTLACLIVLCVSIANSLQILALTQVSVAASINTNNLQTLVANGSLPSVLYNNSVNLPLEFFGSSNSTVPQGLSPTNITKAYNLPSTGGNGTIAIIDAYDDPTILSDANYFSETFQLPLLVNNTTFKEVTIDVPSGQTISTNINATGEISMDVEWAHAIAPNATILLVEANNNSVGCMVDAVYYATTQPDVVAISMSWGCNETWLEGLLGTVGWNETTLDPLFTDSYGASFFAASGDHADNVSWPASSPNVVGVGGTTLNFYSNGSLASETVWNDGNGLATGGGVSAYEPEPSYQASYGVQGSNGMRSVPDVSFDADPVSGVAVYSTSPTVAGTNWLSATGGTSLGAPCWAAIYCLRPTASNPTLYKIAKSVYNSSCFRDITVGSNGNYNATAGYDFCTGLGSPLTGAFNSSLPGDLNFDGTVDIYDAVLLAGAFGATRTSPNWNALADINNDGIVDIYDAMILGSNFGKSYANGSTSGASGQSSSAGTMTEGGASVTVDPSQTTVFKGEVFTVNVDVNDVTDLQGWEFQLYWNSTVLNCTNVAIQTPSQWQNNTMNFGPGLQANYNATTAMYWQAQVATYPASTFNGSMTIVTLTFQAMQPGSTSLTLTDVKLSDNSGDPIACSVSSGSVSVYYGRYMRGATETVNGLGAYVLNIPESTSSAYATESASGSGASWGIRAFVRHSNGSEQEISLNGQTGTPEAVVSRSSGAGLQSATVSVAQTALQSTDSLVIRVYVEVGSSGWTLCATFTTEQLQASTLQATTWTVYYYTAANWNRITQTTSAGF